MDDIKVPKKRPEVPRSSLEKEEIKGESVPKADLVINIDDHNNITDAKEVEDQDNDTAETSTDKSGDPAKKSKRKFSLKNLTKKQKWIVGTSAGVVLLLICLGLFFLLHKKTPKPVPKPVAKIVAPAPVYHSRLTGLPVSLTQSKLGVTGVMVENSDQARPQSGLSSAGVVFEAIAEGGVTRFLALYEEGQPSSIGPVRSARPYYIDWDLGFDAAYAHVGGSADALLQIQNENVKDLNQFYNGSAYTRISTKEAPHNVYTSMSSLLTLEASKGYTTSTFTGFPRKADQPSKDPTATKIDFNIAGPDYEVHYDYDSKNNSYLRSEAGKPMVDANTNAQLDPKVVIAIVVPVTQGALDASDAYYSDYSDIGSGTAYIFQDGTVTQGIWQKASPTSQILFGNSSGSPIALDAGQTWITAVGTSSLVTYSK